MSVLFVPVTHGGKPCKLRRLSVVLGWMKMFWGYSYKTTTQNGGSLPKREEVCVEKLLFGPGSPGEVSTKLPLFRFDFVANSCPRSQFMFAHEVKMKQTNFAYES